MKNFGIKLKTFIQENYRILLSMLGFLTLNLIFFAIMCAKNETPLSSKFFILGTTATIIISIVSCIFLFFARQKSWPIEKIFLLIGTTLGVMYMFIIPMGRTPDEPSHIWRAYSIAEGKILTENQDGISGNYLPENIAKFGNNYNEDAYKLLLDKLTEPISENQVFQRTIGANPIDYLPQILGFSVGRILHLPMIVVLYLARFFGLITCIIIIYFCLKKIPILKKSLFFIACLPLTMQSFIAISYDGLTICSAIALITLVLYFIYNPKNNFKIIHYFISILISIFMIAVKPVYFPLCLLLFFIPNKCFKNKKQKVLSIFAILAITIALFLLWSSISFVTEPGNGADTHGQIAFILSNPLRYIAILVHNTLDMPFPHIFGFGSMEWLDIHANDFYTFATIVFFILLCIKEHITSSTQNKLPKNLRLVTSLLSIAVVFAIYSAMYIQWTAVGNSTVAGIQTRYFLPILLVIPLLCITTKSYKPVDKKKTFLPSIYIYTFIIFLNLNVLSVILCAHA